MAERRRVAVLISGGGSNLQALLDAAGGPGYPAEIVLVASNRPDVYGLARARRAGVVTRVVDHTAHPGREAFEAELDQALRDAGAEIVCLAGFMRVLTAGFVDTWRDRLLNVHPALLPAFRGLRTHARALEAGVRVHGCTVHVVRPALDDGPVVTQGLAPVLPGDDPQTLLERVLWLEHRCFPLALRLLASGRARVEGERVVLADERPGERLLLHPLLVAAEAA